MNKVSAYAKLNLTLGVGGVRDGFHLLDSLVITVSIADEIEILKDGCEPHVEWRAGKVAVGEIPQENNCVRAIRMIGELAGRRGAAVRVTRNIPDRAGLGGSSAQAAGVIRLLCEQWSISLECEAVCAIADAIGSDVRVLLHTGLSRMRGRGEAVERLAARPPLHFVVAMSGSSSTAEVFRAFDALSAAGKEKRQFNNQNTPILESSDPKATGTFPDSTDFTGSKSFALSDMIEFSGSKNSDARSNLFDVSGIRRTGNDLTAAAILCEPRIRTTLERIAATDPVSSGMSGSGAACFGLYETREAAKIAAGRIDADYVTVCEAIY